MKLKIIFSLVLAMCLSAALSAPVKPSKYEQLKERVERDSGGEDNRLVQLMVERQASLQDIERRSWEWHLLSTKLVFGLVASIVVFGLYLSYRQFTRDELTARSCRHVHQTGKDADGGAEIPIAEAPENQPPSNIKIGLTGLEVNSQVIGLLILGFSLAFFYLFVKEVYPVVYSKIGIGSIDTSIAARSEPVNKKANGQAESDK